MIPCNECRECNRRNKPSVTRGSAYCDSHIKKDSIINRIGIFERFKTFLFERRFDDKEKKVNAKGFRKSWFWR